MNQSEGKHTFLDLIENFKIVIRFRYNVLATLTCNMSIKCLGVELDQSLTEEGVAEQIIRKSIAKLKLNNYFGPNKMSF